MHLRKYLAKVCGMGLGQAGGIGRYDPSRFEVIVRPDAGPPGKVARIL